MKLVCDNAVCSLDDLPGGFYAKQGNEGENHLTFKIYRK